MEIVIYFLKENKHHIKCLNACTQAHVMYMCACTFAGDTDRRSCRVQSREGSMSMRGAWACLFCSAGHRMKGCVITHTHTSRDIFTQVSMEQSQPGCTNPIHQLLKPKTPENYRMCYSMCECAFVFITESK